MIHELPGPPDAEASTRLSLATMHVFARSAGLTGCRVAQAGWWKS